jgi:hypothetical protein
VQVKRVVADRHSRAHRRLRAPAARAGPGAGPLAGTAGGVTGLMAAAGGDLDARPTVTLLHSGLAQA